MREWSTHKKLLFLAGAGGGLSEYTASGNPLSFNTNVVKPLLSLLVPFTPTQTGTGDPFPPGGGKNLFDGNYVTGFPSVDGSQASFKNTDTQTKSAIVPCKPNTTYTIKKYESSNRFQFGTTSVYPENGTPISGYTLQDSATQYTYTTGNDANYLIVYVSTSSEQATPQMQVEVGSSATSYQPYSNIRPIVGTSAVNVWHTGKNMLIGTFENLVNEYFPPNVAVSASTEGGNQNGKPQIIFTDNSGNQVGYRTLLTEISGSERTYSNFNTFANSYKYRLNRNPSKAQMELGSTPSDYEEPNVHEYHVVFPALGKNLFNATIEQGTIRASDGVLVVNNTRVRTDYIKLSEGKYTISATGAAAAFICSYGDDGTYYVGESTPFKNFPFSFNVADGRKIRIVFRKANDSDEIVPSDVSNVMLNTGETAQPYEPYTNTVYGGSLDLTTGVLTATYRLVTLTGQEGFNFTAYGSSLYANDPIFSDSESGSTLTGWCSMTTTVDGKVSNYIYKAYSDHGLQFRYVETYWGLSEVTSNAMNAKLQEWYEAGTPLQVCYLLATPITYQLTPQQITALLGDNVIWSDTNGTNTATYYKKG